MIDENKGIRKTAKDAFGKLVVIQRCQHHKRKNVLCYLNEANQKIFRGCLTDAYKCDRYDEAKTSLDQIPWRYFAGQPS